MTRRSRRGWTPRRGSSGSGDEDSPSNDWTDLRTNHARDDRAVFPPQQVAEVKAIACELPVTHGLPLSRFSRTELHRLVFERGVTDASASTIWRWLHDDAIKPWQTRSWIFPRAPDTPAAADNYVARVTETVVQDPRAYVQLVRSVWVPTAQEAALEEGTRARARSADAIENLRGGRARVGARRGSSA
jgi:hypothetical protein